MALRCAPPEGSDGSIAGARSAPTTSPRDEVEFTRRRLVPSRERGGPLACDEDRSRYDWQPPKLSTTTFPASAFESNFLLERSGERERRCRSGFGLDEDSCARTPEAIPIARSRAVRQDQGLMQGRGLSQPAGAVNQASGRWKRRAFDRNCWISRAEVHHRLSRASPLGKSLPAVRQD